MDNFENFLRKCRKKRKEEMDEMDEIWSRKRKKRRVNEDDLEETISVLVPAAVALCQVKERKERIKSKVRNKTWWIEGYDNWDDADFKKRLRISRETFEYIVNLTMGPV